MLMMVFSLSVINTIIFSRNSTITGRILVITSLLFLKRANISRVLNSLEENVERIGTYLETQSDITLKK